MHRILWVLASIAAVLALAQNSVDAQSSSAAMTVNASVSRNCVISTSPVNFGAYDPVAANATSPLDGVGLVTLTCTKGALAHISLSLGNNSVGNTRRMSQTSTAFLTYEIYKDAARTQVWGYDVFLNIDMPPAPNNQPRNVVPYGRVAAGQDAAVGNYTDSLIATVHF